MLKSLTAGSISGTGTVESKSKIIGAIAVSTDGTNAGTVIVKEVDANGAILYSISGLEAMHIPLHILTINKTWYYSISGTGCTAQIFEEQPL